MKVGTRDEQNYLLFEVFQISFIPINTKIYNSWLK